MDYLLSLSRNRTTRNVVKSLGLPLTLPPVLVRSSAPRRLRLLDDVEVIVGCSTVTAATRELGRHLAPMGARVAWTGEGADVALFRAGSEAWAEPVRVAVVSEHQKASDWAEGGSRGNGTAVEGAGVNGPAPNGGTANPQPRQSGRAHGLVFDATGLQTRRDLDGLFAFFTTWVRELGNNGRVVLLASPPDVAEQVVGSERAAEVAALWQGLEGFVRSLAKELGRKGTTVNLLWVVPEATHRIVGPLRFLLARQSAFVTAQPLRVDCQALGEARVSEAPLAGKVALVTGGARGIGRAAARSLFAEGAKVAVIEHPSAASEASTAAREFGGKLLLCDLGEAAAAEKIRQWVAAELGGVDIVVHNAGLTRDKTLARMQKDAWDSVLDVNLVAIVRSTEELLRGGLVRDQGRIVALSSVGGIAGNVGQTNYAYSKAGLIGWARTLSRQLASRGITVNAVAPGFIETQMTAKMPPVIREVARRLSALNQGGLPEDVAEAVTFFALPENVGVTGSVLRVCGGALIGA